MIDKKILSNDPISKLFVSRQINTFQAASSYVKQLPYGRTLPRNDFAQVLIQQKGTCSSKHALVKTLADENEWADVELHMIIYAMNQSNTPGIGNTMVDYAIPYIPEAHCILSVDGTDMDLTSQDSSIDSWCSEVLQRRIIGAQDTATNKIEWHRQFIDQWIEDHAIAYSLDEIWAIRERCIDALSEL